MSEDNKENILDLSIPPASLQKSFAEFKKTRHEKFKLKKYLRDQTVDRSTSEFQMALRGKFIETAKKYIGVPYAQRYARNNWILKKKSLIMCFFWSDIMRKEVSITILLFFSIAAD
jgi:hypothetical protein